jgi:hypothetical protein
MAYGIVVCVLTARVRVAVTGSKTHTVYVWYAIVMLHV